MDFLITGIITGTLTAVVFIVLLEKCGKTLQNLLIGHYLFTDIVATFLAYILFPVVGLATMISAAIFCICFTTYLHWKRKTIQHTTLPRLVRVKLSKIKEAIYS